MDKIGDMDPPDEAGFTIDDLHAIPEGRLRYELIEGRAGSRSGQPASRPRSTSGSRVAPSFSTRIGTPQSWRVR